MQTSWAILNAVDRSTGLTGSQMIERLANRYTSFRHAINSEKLRFTNLERVSKVYSVMLAKGWVYQETTQPLYFKVSLTEGSVLSSCYKFSIEIYSINQQALPVTMAFLATKAVISLDPVNFSGYIVNSTKTELSHNSLDLMHVFYGASIEFDFLQSMWLDIPIKDITGGITTPIFNNRENDSFNTVQLGPNSTEEIPEFKEYMLMLPQESFSIKLKFANGFDYAMYNKMQVNLKLQGTMYYEI